MIKKMSNKVKRQYLGLINKKLDSMGIKRELRFRQVCVKKMLVMTDSGKLELRPIPRFMAQSVRRQMRTQLIDSGAAVVEAFLKMDTSKFKGGQVQA